MTLRTPRRRISPRTKRRYRAIRNFLRRAIGSASQHDIKINSGIAVNVSSLKHKIFGLEQKRSEANKGCHCQQSGLEDSFRRESASTLHTEVEKEPEEYREQRTSSPNCRRKQQELEQLSESSSARVETDTNYQRVEDEAKPRMSNLLTPDRVPVTHYDGNDNGYKKKKSKHKLYVGASHALLRSPSITTYENRVNANSTTSIEVQNTSKYNRNNKRSNQRSSRIDCIIDDPINYYLEDVPKYKENKKQRTESPTKRLNQDRQKQKSKANIQEGTLDRDFIDELIKRQYSPVRLFERRTSDISQFTEPVCRDRMPRQSKNSHLQENPSYLEKVKYVQNSDLNNKLSVCDARLYGSKRRSRSKHHRNVDAYDSKYYDVIPVKEKASPKSRRKFVEDNLFPNNRSPYYIEVPPSPRSNRPRLNLRAQYYDQYEDYMVHAPPVKKARSPMRVRKVYIPVETDVTSDSRDQEVITQVRARPNKSKNCVQEELVPPPQEMYHTYSDVQDNFVINDTLINKSQEACATDKTDKALSEIKDLLQTFLSEIKNSSLSKSDSSNKNESIQACEQMLPSTASDRISNPSNNPNRFQNFNPLHANVPGHMPNPISAPFIPPMNNPCYPLLPMCPLNMQPGYVMPTPSFTCTACINSCSHCPIHKTSGEAPSKDNSEIDDLIKEIHKLVAKKEGKESFFRSNTEDLSARTNVLTRSGGGISQVQHQDAQVGTTKLRCYSKSCEAIGSTMVAESYPNGSYSDTVLERMSLNPSIDTTSFETRTTEKNNMRQRFNVLLKSLGLLKKKKKNPKYAIEVISEADNRAFLEPSQPPPFPSDVTNYMMYGQEYASPPPYPLHHSPRHYCPYGDHEFGKYNQYSMREPVAEALPRRRSPLKHERVRGHSPSAPPYSPNYMSNPYMHPSQQGPLCLREVEVKSIATQSEVQKPSFFAKFAKKTHQNGPPVAYTMPATTAPLQPPLPQQQSKRGFFSRGNNVVPQPTSAPQPVPSRLDAWKYQLKMQQELANGDQKIRNVLLKKMFSKRNPFSPRNPIMKTILGKDTEYEQKYLKFGGFKPKMLF